LFYLNLFALLFFALGQDPPFIRIILWTRVTGTVFIWQGIPQQPGTRQIARLIAFFPGYFVFKNENFGNFAGFLNIFHWIRVLLPDPEEG
jgi:hypothetical protein